METIQRSKEDVKKFKELIKNVDVCMFTTLDDNYQIHSRPMSTAQVDEEGNAWFFTNEFSDFNFASASQRLKDAWNAKLGKIDVQNADQLTKQMLYTGLYSVYANIENATDGSPYAPYVAAYGSPLLTIGSSVGWAYIGGGYFRAAYDQRLAAGAITPDPAQAALAASVLTSVNLKVCRRSSCIALTSACLTVYTPKARAGPCSQKDTM